MQLYNTKVVPSATDALWVPPALPDMTGAVLLIITTPYAQDGAESQTLQKMMAACKLSQSDYAVLEIPPDAPYSWQAIAASGAPKAVLLLGVLPAQLSIHALFRLHAPNHFGGHIFIPALSLKEIESNPAAKKELWASGLKPLFGL